MAPDHEHLHHYLDHFVGWKAGLPIYLAMVAVPIAIGFRGADMGFVGLTFGLLAYLAIWRVTRTRDVPLAVDPTIGSNVS